MIGEKYSDNHPCIMEFNGGLNEVYSTSADEGKKEKTIQIAQKNLEIARTAYGEKSLYVLKYELALASNKIGVLKLVEAQENIANMRKIVQFNHDDDPYKLSNQFLFLGQTLVAITFMNT